MKISAINFYSNNPKARYASGKANKIAFGTIENYENTKRLLPASEKEWKYLEDHDVITVTSEGDKAWATAKEGFEKLYRFLFRTFMDKPDNMHDLENPYDFEAFIDALKRGDSERSRQAAGITASVPEDYQCNQEPEWDSWDEVLWLQH